MRHVETISLPHDLSEFSEIIDVRAPGEFAEDHIPGAVNLPVLSDTERERVGIIYNSDPFAARKLGAEYISHNAAKHLAGHFEKKERTYAPLIYCWRGGMRSNSLAHILRQIGWRARVLEGGYKTFRKHVTEDLENRLAQPELTLTVLAGQTGVAKTRLLHTLDHLGAQVLDLEGLANHKGSVLGLEPDTHQPSQKRFESLLWEKLQQLDASKPVFTEAESNRIGRLHCPPALWKKLGEGKVVEVTMPLEKRAEFLLDDYPYFTANPEHLQRLLEKLTKLRGKAQITQWHLQIDQGEWKVFVESMLRDHYDLVYRRAGDEKSNYPAPSKTLTLVDFSSSSLSQAAQDLLRCV